jgi:hypothetical protein
MHTEGVSRCHWSGAGNIIHAGGMRGVFIILRDGRGAALLVQGETLKLVTEIFEVYRGVTQPANADLPLPHRPSSVGHRQLPDAG